MQFRKTMKNKKRFRGGNFLFNATTDVIKIIKDNSPGTAFDNIRKYCVAEGIGCRENFLNIIKNPSNLALAGISIAAYAAYLAKGTREKQDEILQKIEKIKKERRESEESSDTNNHRDSKYEDSSLLDEGDEDMDASISQKTYKQSYKKIEDKQKIINDLVGRSKGRSKDRKSRSNSRSRSRSNSRR